MFGGAVMIAAMVCFGVAALIGVYRLLIGPGLADRVMALDVTLVCLMGAIAVDAARRDDTTFLILMVVLAIVGFTATVAASTFIEHEADDGDAMAQPTPGASSGDLDGKGATP